MTELVTFKRPDRQLPDIMDAYAEYVADSESPEVFHMWVCIGTIAGAAQRKILMSTAYFDIHTNLYIILVSPPGVGKKTTALRIGKNMLKNVKPEVNFATEATSAGALIKAMSEISSVAHQSMTLFSSELGTLLANDAVSMVDFLTDIYDGNPDWHKQTLKRGSEKISHPWLNLLAGTTPQWLGDNLSSTAVEGGLVSRSIYPFSAELILRSSFPEETPRQTELRRQITNDLSRIATLEGTFRFDPEARRFYDTWYLDKSRYPKLMDSRTAGYYSRKHIHVLKVAMALSLSYKDDLVLLKKDIEQARRLLDGTEVGMKQAFSAVGKNEYATDLERVLSQIRTKRSVSYGELLGANYNNLGKRGLDIIIDELRYMGVITVDTTTKLIWAEPKEEKP